ncbi:MAG TPA: DUF5131 family protein [Phycisphaerae bacterium]|nr:DUF5131 family protein [Phycisphaerae bacterium]
MNRTKIEWVSGQPGVPGYTWNPLVGCTHGCSFCYARRFARRSKCPQCQTFTPHAHPERIHQPEHVKKPSRIFVMSMGDPACFEDGGHEWTISNIIAVSYNAPRHRYYLLTKRPTALRSIEFPEWWTVGVSCGESLESWDRIAQLWDCIEAEHRFVSVEPLLVPQPKMQMHLHRPDWIIVGAQTGPNRQPVADLARVHAEASWWGTPFFLKDNGWLPVLGDKSKWQSFPDDLPGDKE